MAVCVYGCMTHCELIELLLQASLLQLLSLQQLLCLAGCLLGGLHLGRELLHLREGGGREGGREGGEGGRKRGRDYAG